jgi:hypothetical protein
MMPIFLVAASLLTAASAAQDTPLAGEGAAGDMHVAQVTITDIAAYGDQYRAGGVPQSATGAAIGDRIFTMIFFDRCRAGANGMCRLVAELRLVDPDGHVGDPQTGTVWQFQPPTAGRMAMGQDMIGVQLGTARSPGDYRFRVTTQDMVAGTEVTTERVLAIGAPR